MDTNVIYNEDCLEGMKRIPDNSIDMILADLPYGTTACKWDSIIPLDKLWKQYKRIIKDRVAIVLTASQPFTTKLISSNMEWFRYCWVWEKEQGVDPFMTKYRPLNNYEDVCVFYKKQSTYNPQMEEGEPYHTIRDKISRDYEITNTKMKMTETVNDGYRYPTRILEFKQEKGKHPTQKPVALFEYLIKTYTNENEIVLDNVIGSGTTAVACLSTNRKFIGFEIEEKYYNIALKRIGKFDKTYYEKLPEEEKPKQTQLF